MKPNVYVVIVNWNGEQDTVDCLESLRRVEYDNYHVIVSDNGSRGEGIAAIEDWIQRHLAGSSEMQWRVLKNGRNLGFTGANAVGMDVALAEGADYVLFLNNDTIVTPEFLGQMVDAAESDPRVGICGCKIYFADPDETTGRHRIWSLGGYRFRFGIPLSVGFGLEDRPEWRGNRPQQLINGCCMLIKRKVIETIGAQSDELFFGQDDVEYSFRAARAGWKNLVVCDATIYHRASRSVVAKSALQAYYLFRNTLFFRFRSFPWYRNVWFVAMFVTRYVIAGCIGRWLTGRNGVNAGVILGIKDYFAGPMGECGHPELACRPSACDQVA